MIVALKTADYDALRRHATRYRDLLSACIESDGSPFFTAEEIEEMVDDRYAECKDRLERGLPMREGCV